MRFFHRWYGAWLLQWLTMFLVGACISALQVAGGLVAASALWVLSPLAGCISAYRTTLRGLNNYLAWFAPPIGVALMHYVIWTYPPSFACILVCAFVSLVGAAAGEVQKNERLKHK